MARYNREFLVPYLQNICALHFAEQKIRNRISRLQREIMDLERGVWVMRPAEPTLDDDIGGGDILGFVFGVAMLVWAWNLFHPYYLAGFPEGAWPMIIVLLVGGIGVFAICAAIRSVRWRDRTNKERLADFQEKQEEYERVQAENQETRKLIPGVKAELQEWHNEHRRVEKLIHQNYDVNIIPNRYRDVYTVVYLYDWFSSTHEDDVTAALNMFVLEEIKAKLDRIIANQSEIILNQCMIEANQRRTLEQQEQHSRMMHSRLNQIQASNEERNTYLSMIESNTRANAYFAAATYISNL